MRPVGRERIIMSEWGPWDHESPLVRRVPSRPSTHAYELLGLAGPVAAEISSGGVQLKEVIAGERRSFEVSASGTGIYPYRVHWRAPGLDHSEAATLAALEWQVRVFPWMFDPRQQDSEWLRAAEGPQSHQAIRECLDFRFGGGGPRQLGLCDASRAEGPGDDRFGLIARVATTLPAGRWRATTWSDDGVRVTIAGQRVIDNWTWHGPTRDEAMFVNEEAQRVEMVVEYFELDGHAQISFELILAEAVLPP
jgi:hypothetical protein